MARTSENGEQPTFDFSRYSHRDALKMDLDMKRVIQADSVCSDPAVMRDPEAFEAALETYTVRMATVEQHICDTLVSVPRAWLMPDAPADLDWKKPESLGWLRHDKFTELSEAMNEARRPENVSKNSVKR
jgi:hypothetical protein